MASVASGITYRSSTSARKISVGLAQVPMRWYGPRRLAKRSYEVVRRRTARATDLHPSRITRRQLVTLRVPSAHSLEGDEEQLLPKLERERSADERMIEPLSAPVSRQAVDGRRCG